MKTILISTLAAAGLVLSVSSAFAVSNSPQGRVVNGGDDPMYSNEYTPTPEGRFLSGQVYDDRAYEGVPSRTYYDRPVMRRDGYMYEQGDD